VTASQIQVVIIGDRPECEDLIAAVASLCPLATPPRLRRFVRIEDARSAERQGDDAPQLVVVIQTWPDQFSSGYILKLLTRFPLARLVCCQGPWCDSDGRTRDLWPAACRVRLEIAPVRIARELALVEMSVAPQSPAASADRPPAPAFLPLTASRAEVFAFDFSERLDDARPPRSVAVESPDGTFREMLRRARRAGFTAAGIDQPPSADVIVWDADPWDAIRADILRQMHSANPDRPIVACAGFMRPDLATELRGCGATGVWFKLAPLAALRELITGVAGGGSVL
jgi:hypothetical protein